MIELKVRKVNLRSGGPKVVVINERVAEREVIKPMDRVRIITKKGPIIAIVNTSSDVPEDEIWIYKEIWEDLEIGDEEKVLVSLESKPRAVEYIKKKLDGHELSEEEIFDIIHNINKNTLSEVEAMAFIVSSYTYGLSLEETYYLTKAIAETGRKLDLNVKQIADKHCIGGIPNNRTTMLIVPILAAAGVYIPKTSSRAITSPAGTADTMEVLAPVDLSIEEMREVVLKTRGCIIWGGGTEIASADDKLIRLRRSLSLDPEGMLLASVLAKKYAVGAEYLLIDIPVGRHAKVTNFRDAYKLKSSFERLGRMLGMNTHAIITDGSQPIGNGIGPALEARDVLWILSNDSKGPFDLREKAESMAGLLLEMVGLAKEGEGILMAKEIISSGKALNKFKEIVEAQGGDPNVRPEDLPIGQYTYDFLSPRNGMISEINIKAISKVARYAGAPFDKGAGIYLYKKVGDFVKADEKILTIYSESETKLDYAIRILEEENPIKII